jgi:hypothetical protein
MLITPPKCPKCEGSISSVEIRPMTASLDLSTAYKGAAYCCPNCSAVLSFEMDPIALKAELIKNLKKIVENAVEDCERKLRQEIQSIR